MLDIKTIKNDPKYVKQAMKNRQKDFDKEIDELLEIDAKRRKILAKTENIKAEQNAVSKKIPEMKKAGEDTSKIFSEMKKFSSEAADLNTMLSDLEEKQNEIILSIPNIPDKSVPIGKNSDENVEIRCWGEPRKFDFKPLPHWELGKQLDILDAERAAKVTGSRFHFYKGIGAKLERAIISFFLDTHIENGYEEILPPYIVNKNSLYGTGQLPKFDNDNMFKLEGTGYYLIPTAEVPVTNYHSNEIMWGKDLTKKYCAYSSCFRAEAGSAGRDTRGLIRQHQFNKVELVKFCKPEDSFKELEALTNDAEKLLQLLEIPYRVVCLCSGDMGFVSAKTYDIEVWMPSYGKYVEISSCSNFLDYQARRAKIRFKNEQGEKAQLVHTLNGSGLAVGRTFAAILENFQTKEGFVVIPEILKKYMSIEILKR